MADGREAAAAGAGFLSLFKETITESQRFASLPLSPQTFPGSS